MQRVRTFSAALILTLSSISTFGAGVVHAAGNTCTWTGSGGNANFSTAANWSGCAGGAPTDDDNLVFNALGSDTTVTNDISGLSIGTITFSDTNDTGFAFTIAGSTPLTVTGGIVANQGFNEITAPLVLGGDVTISESSASSGLDIGALNLNGNDLTVNTTLYVDGVVSGSGNITNMTQSLYLNTAASTWQGSLHVGSTAYVTARPGTLGNASNNITVDAGGMLILCQFNGATLSQSFNLASDGSSSNALVSAAACGSGSAPTESDPVANVTLAGAVTLTSNVVVGSSGILTVTGPLSGAHTITLDAGNVGSLVINSSSNTSSTPNGNASSNDVVTTYSDDNAAQDISVDPKNIVIVTGKRGDVSLNGGTLKGTGTVGSITMTAGTVAPGMSPGILNSGNVDFQAGTFQAELGGTTAGTGYDQLKVTGTVSLTGSALQIMHYNNFRPAQGNTFIVIDNDGTDAVTGTFSSLAEGATTTVDGVVYSITYKGGDGNDVVLTAVTVPAAPKTGFKLVTANPVVTMAATIAAAGGLLLVARAQKRPAAKRR